MSKKNKDYHGLSGKIGGLAVKGMIQEVEQEMAAGKHVSAAPSNAAEAEMLNLVKQENQESGKHAKN